MSSKLAASGPRASLSWINPSLLVSAAFPRSERGGNLDLAGVVVEAVDGCFFGHPDPLKKPLISAPSRPPFLSQSMSSKLAASGPRASLSWISPSLFVSAAFPLSESSFPWALTGFGVTTNIDVPKNNVNKITKLECKIFVISIVILTPLTF